tara:strand:- start:637 stop:1977 length:1341 start_codon:yes stop_codon:yes gene_type:complete
MKELDFKTFMAWVEKRNPNQPEFIQAVQEVAASVIPFINKHPKYLRTRVLERMTEPDRAIVFRVAWEDDSGNVQINKGYRVQFNNAIGPYKGGLRFHPSVDMSILKFLGFEQTFKNSLTSLALGGGKGGSDFEPKGKSDREIMRFCQAFMTELFRHIGADIDVPAGDIGVGNKEIGYLFGQYKRIIGAFNGALTGKQLEIGGSHVRTEATGYGVTYFLNNMLKEHGQTLEGKTCLVSGSGNVALYAAEKLIELGAKVITMSDSSGFIHDPKGLTKEKLEYIIDLKTNKLGRIDEYAKKFGCRFYPNKKPWEIKADVAIPCATQNEITVQDAKKLIKNKCIAVCEGSNMPTELHAIKTFLDSKVLFAPSKAANAGGVAVSGLEMAQNSMRVQWTKKKLCSQLVKIMDNIHKQCVKYGEGKEQVNYIHGANIGGFVKVADAMIANGVF